MVEQLQRKILCSTRKISAAGMNSGFEVRKFQGFIAERSLEVGNLKHGNLEIFFESLYGCSRPPSDIYN